MDSPPEFPAASGAAAFAPPRSLADWRVPEDIVDKIVSAMLMVFLFFFFVGSKFTAFRLPVRVEDLIFIILAPLSYRYWARPKSPLFYLIALYFTINLIPYFAAFAVGEYNLSTYPVIMVKEVEYFYVAYLISVNRNRWVLRTVDALALLIIAYGCRELVLGRISYYGIGSIGNTSAPSLSGAMYLFSTMWLHVRSKLIDRIALRPLALLVIFAGSLCTVATVSRSSIAALAVYWVAYLFVGNFKWVPWILVLIALSVPGVQKLADPHGGTGIRYIAQEIVYRMSQAGSAAVARSNKWQYDLGDFSPAELIFGRGKGYPNARDNTLAMGVDSQYVRTIMENGFVGLALVGIIMITFLAEIYRRGGEVEHALGMNAAMLVMSIPFEAMQVSKSGGFFWLLFFYLLLAQRKQAPDTAT